MTFKYAIEQLQAGKKTSICPKGNSMRGKVESGSTVQLEPCKADDLAPGDIVLVRVKGRVYLHLIKAIRLNKGKTSFQIGNNVGGINGWVGPSAIYGKAIKISKE
jgi:SOS-response transcriptional repressor LexA